MSLTCISPSPHTHGDFSVVRKLANARFPIYLAKSNHEDKKYALKVFPFEDGKASIYYINESHFSHLTHPHIITVYHCQNEKKSIANGKHSKISYILMEYAPHGDFYDLLITDQIELEDKLARTYFHHLIKGLEYLHSQGIAHMDIKLENLLLGEDFKLKITDFDLSFFEGDEIIHGHGSQYYRAPELINGTCVDPQAADIYSAAVILFLLKAKGKLPHSENVPYNGLYLDELMHADNESFWDIHCDIQGKDRGYFDEDFKALFNMMTKLNPLERGNISDIKKSRWFNQPIYTCDELKSMMKKKILGYRSRH